MLAIVVNEDIQIFLRVINDTNSRTLSFVKGVSDVLRNILREKSKVDLNERHEPSPTALEDMVVNNGDKYHTRTHDLFLKRHTHHNDNEDSQAVFSALDTVLKDTLERLKKIRKHGDFNSVFSIRGLMVKAGVPPNTFTYNILIYSEVKRGNVLDALFLKQNMFDKGFFPDVITYNMLIGAMCNIGYVHYAVQFYNEMLRSECEPDIITYTELIRGHCMKGNMKVAVNFFKIIRGSGLPLDHVPFQILIKKYCKMGEPEKALDLYQEMKERGIRSRPSTYYALIAELDRKGYTSKANEICDHMVTWDR